ncbi:hypothetical protein [Bosea sp. (in: a-proteobacteria)]
MSLTAFAIRTCLWRALYGRTYAETRVHDSDVQPIAEMLSADPLPFLIVSTDDDIAEVEGHRFSEAGRKLDVVIEIVVAAVHNVGGEGDPDYKLIIPATDDGFETTVNFIGRQAMRVMQADDSVWADLFRSFTPGAKRMVSKRGAETKPRYAARQIVVTCDTLCEPAFGEEPADEWARLIAAMQDDTILAPYAPVLAAEIRGEVLPDWKRLQAALGATRAGVSALGLGSLLPGEAPATFQQAVIAGDVSIVVVTP